MGPVKPFINLNTLCSPSKLIFPIFGNIFAISSTNHKFFLSMLKRFVNERMMELYRRTIQ